MQSLSLCNFIEQYQILHNHIQHLRNHIRNLHIVDFATTSSCHTFNGNDHRILNISDFYVKILISIWKVVKLKWLNIHTLIPLSYVYCAIISIWATHIINPIDLICTRYTDYLADTCRTPSSPLTFWIIDEKKVAFFKIFHSGWGTKCSYGTLYTLVSGVWKLIDTLNKIGNESKMKT